MFVPTSEFDTKKIPPPNFYGAAEVSSFPHDGNEWKMREERKSDKRRAK